MIEFYWPGSTGEWLAFAVAVVTVGFGLLLFLMPRLSFGILRLQPVEGRADAIAEGRATMAGFYLGCGLGCGQGCSAGWFPSSSIALVRALTGCPCWWKSCWRLYRWVLRSE